MSTATETNGAQLAHPTHFLVFSASLRAESLNSRLAKLAAGTIEKNGGIVDLQSMAAFDCPSYDQDAEDADGIPAGAAKLKECVEANDAIVIASPEYNSAMPGLLKNAIDWVSRFRPQPFNERHILLMSASPSMVGGNRGLWSLRVPLEHLGARVYPDMFSLATAHQMLAPDGTFANATLGERFEKNVVAFMSLAEAAKNYPCIKKAWVEFLGERPDALTERVE